MPPAGHTERHDARRNAGDRLEVLRRSLQARLPGCRVTAALRDGPATEVLLDEADSAELLVVGSPVGPHAAGGSGPATHPSAPVVQAVTRRARCPVLVFRPRDAAPGPVVAAVTDEESAPRLLAVAALQATTGNSALVVLESAAV
jgi:hypothetical protein